MGGLIEAAATVGSHHARGMYNPDTRHVTVMFRRPGVWLEAGGGVWNGETIEGFTAKLPPGLYEGLCAALKEKFR